MHQKTHSKSVDRLSNMLVAMFQWWLEISKKPLYFSYKYTNTPEDYKFFTTLHTLSKVSTVSNIISISLYNMHFSEMT